jgi:hypothetical protein
MKTETIALHLTEEQGRRLTDPVNHHVHHFETYLPFSEAAKLQRGNANVRPAKETSSTVRAMQETARETPDDFHLKNRGISYICQRFHYDNKNKQLSVTIPVTQPDDDDAPRYGIADGGHTFSVVLDTVEKASALKEEDKEWTEPYVRVHFLAGDPEKLGVENVVEGLNTSTQVKLYTLEEYRGKFEPLKGALDAAGFDSNLVAFRENEDKEWQVTEVIQRLACFLKDRWRITPPSSMYRSKDKPLQLFLEDKDNEFSKLYPVVKDIITLPEYIQSSLAEFVEGRRLGGVRGIKKQKVKFRRPGTEFLSQYKMDGAIVLPMAAAFRSLLGVRQGKYTWRADPYETFRKCAQDMYDVMLQRIRRVKNASQLAFDQEYWISCERVVLNVRNEDK